MRWLAAIVALTGCGTAAAQFELRVDLSVSSVSPAARQTASISSASVFSVQRRTGEIVYNRANAFGDPIYNQERWRRLDPLAAARGTDRAPREHRSLAWRGAIEFDGAGDWAAPTLEPWRPTGATRRFELIEATGAVAPGVLRPGAWAPAGW